MPQDSNDNEEFFVPEGSLCTKNIKDLSFVSYIEEYYKKNWKDFFNILKNK